MKESAWVKEIKWVMMIRMDNNDNDLFKGRAERIFLTIE